MSDAPIFPADIPPHPLAAKYPLLDGDDYEELKESIRLHGLLNPIWLFEGKILDGRNRYRACRELGIEPEFATYEGDQPEGFGKAQNVDRRHLSAEWRRAQVKAKRAEGKSTRQIADEMGVPKSTVADDLKAGVRVRTPAPSEDLEPADEEAPEPEPAPAPVVVKGRDGKKYAARRKKKAVTGTLPPVEANGHGRPQLQLVPADTEVEVEPEPEAHVEEETPTVAVAEQRTEPPPATADRFEGKLTNADLSRIVTWAGEVSARAKKLQRKATTSRTQADLDEILSSFRNLHLAINAAEIKLSALADAEDPPPGEREVRGKGIALAEEAINCLIRIPKNDALRSRGLQIVEDWVERNQ